MDDRLEHAAAAIADADRAAVMTGAGISTDSGIPDFRGPDGIWADHDPDAFHVRRFRVDPEGFWRDWADIADDVLPDEAAPNPGHEAIADLVDAGQLEAVITQNTDGLHQAAGVPSADVIELHGNTSEAVCEPCRNRLPADEVVGDPPDRNLPPRCPACGGVLKPGGVLFGEQLPKSALLRAHALAENADAFLVVGSSLTVEPAASLPETAVEKGATLIVNNLDPTPLSSRAAVEFREGASDVLPRLRDAVLK